MRIAREEDEYQPRAAHEFPDWKLEEMNRMAVDQVLRPD
jgi:hypothetical protein